MVVRPTTSISGEFSATNIARASSGEHRIRQWPSPKRGNTATTNRRQLGRISEQHSPWVRSEITYPWVGVDDDLLPLGRLPHDPPSTGQKTADDVDAPRLRRSPTPTEIATKPDLWADLSGPATKSPESAEHEAWEQRIRAVRWRPASRAFQPDLENFLVNFNTEPEKKKDTTPLWNIPWISIDQISSVGWVGGLRIQQDINYNKEKKALSIIREYLIRGDWVDELQISIIELTLIISLPILGKWIKRYKWIRLSWLNNRRDWSIPGTINQPTTQNQWDLITLVSLDTPIDNIL